MQRRAPQEFVDAWDAWLQDCLHVSRQQLAGQWLDLYLTSPVWRFVLAEGICGEAAYAGVMLPSVDRVGRYFPLTIVSPLEPGTCILEAACGSGRAWFDAAEELALRALDAGELDLHAFDAEVDALPGLGACAPLAESNQLMELVAQSGFPRRGLPSHISMLGESPQRAINAFASIELQKAFRPCALWWTQGSEAVAPGWLVTSGLPAPSGYVAMLSGQWLAAGWHSVEFASQVLSQEQAQAAPPAAMVSEDEPEAPRPFDLQMVAAHSPPRHGVRASVAARYMMRPETGLWGMVVAVEGSDPGARADLIADVTHDLAPQATLTTGIESARRALQKVLTPGTGIILFLTERTEYAVLWSGALQAVRFRGGSAVESVGGESTGEAGARGELAAPEIDRDGSDADDGGLLALLTAPAAREVTLSVCYGELEANDLWVLGSEGSIPDTLPDAAGDPSAPASPQKVLDAHLARHALAKGAAEPPPLMLIAAQPAGPAAT